MTTSRYHRLLPLLGLAAVAAVGCSPVTEPVADGAPATLAKKAANGLQWSAHAIHVRLQNMALNTIIVDLYSFNARQIGTDAKGKFHLYQERIVAGQPAIVIIAAGEIECVTVAGNRARVGGRVTYTTFPEGIPVGSELTWSVTDNGTSARAQDFASQPFGNNARAYCALGLPFPETPVLSGKITIKD